MQHRNGQAAEISSCDVQSSKIVKSLLQVKYLRRLDSKAAAEKHAKTVLVPNKAVTRMPGWVASTICTIGPKVAPSKRAQPASSPYLHADNAVTI